MTSVDFKLPYLGEGVDSADVAELLVREGDQIELDQPVIELETEKAVMEVPSPYAGRVTKVHIQEGETIAAGQVLLTIETDSVTDSPSPDKTAPATEEQASDVPATPKAEPNKVSPPSQTSETASPPGDPADEQHGKATEASPPTQQAGTVTPKTSSGEELLEFRLPHLGEGVETADVAEVLVAPGETIREGQPVIELETEKAVMEVPSPFSGTVSKVLVSSGETVRVGQLLLMLHGSASDAPSSGKTPVVSKRRTETPKTPASQPAIMPEQQPAAADPAPPANALATNDRPTSSSRADQDRPPVPAAPSTRRLARKLGVDLHQVPGSGPGGRVTREDVQAFVRRQLEDRQLSAPSGNARAVSSLAPPPLPDFSRFGPVDRERLNKIARTAAENLALSWHVIPHVTQHDRADVTELEAARKRFGQRIGKEGPKVTMTAIAIKALATCLQSFPKFNSSLDPETQEIVYKRYYHIGCAVDTPLGLLVPVIRDCDQKSILEIAAELTRLAQQARDKKLSMEAMQGATCTVTNLGGIGGTAFTPIVNYPEVCILGMSRTQTELQLIDDQLSERLLLPLALSYDHRVINGADAARFLASLCQMLSDPFQLLSAI